MTFVDMLQRVRGPSHSSEELEVSMTVNHSSIPALRSPIKTPCRKHSVSTADSGSTIESSSVAVTPKSFSDPSLLSPLTPLTPLTSPQYEDGELSKLSIRFDRKRKPDVLGPLSQLPRMKRLRSSSRTITHQETIASRTRDGPASFNQLKPFRPLPLRCNEPAKLMPSPQPQYTSRNLLQHKGKHIIEISPDFPLFYRRYPASSYFRTTERSSPFSLFQVTNPGGKGSSKVGLCPICVEPLNRGGEDKKVWLHMKFSAFKCYHMQCAHGISASTGQPFSPPVAFRSVKRHNPGKNERSLLKEGKCHKCSKWVPIEGIKDLESKVKELYWYAYKPIFDPSSKSSKVETRNFLSSGFIHCKAK
ncbi:hypothetical protein AX16_007849 [Volvariella volvacea WC 439]|nr:hypothetical protein AX16_007849 [Volvariella volvacea WC 439]